MMPNLLFRSHMQAASMGAEFLTVDIKEDGESATGYSKEMSPAFIAAEVRTRTHIPCMSVSMN